MFKLVSIFRKRADGGRCVMTTTDRALPGSGIEPALEVYFLGRIDFDEAMLLQRRLVYEVGESGLAAMIMCEHDPVISVGRSGSRAHIKPDDEQLRAMSLKTRWVNRGGGCVLHVPGQLGVYFALPLDRLGIGVRGLIDGLHDSLIATLADFDVPGKRIDGKPGVFVGEERIASIGIAIDRWIAYHGLTLNIGAYLPFFRILDEPGPFSGGLRQTSMEAIRRRPAHQPAVRETLVRKIEERFSLRTHYIYTSHPSLARRVRPGALYAEAR